MVLLSAFYDLGVLGHDVLLLLPVVGGLRVVEFAHPLLAGWALEAIAAAKLEDAEDVPRSSQRAATGFTFSSKWEEQEGEPWIVFFPESDDS